MNVFISNFQEIKRRNKLVHIYKLIKKKEKDREKKYRTSTTN